MTPSLHIVLGDPTRRAPWVSERSGDALLEIQEGFDSVQTSITPQRTLWLFGERQPAVFPDGFPNDTWFRSRRGRFLCVASDARGQVMIANDRFASIPLFYAVTARGLEVSTDFMGLCRTLRSAGEFSWDPKAFYQFLHLQRLMGDQTYESHTQFLNAASVMVYETATRRLQFRKYWHPPLEEPGNRPDEWAEELAAGLKSAYRSHTRSNERVGLLLSGGLDSRLVLAACERPPLCFTMGDTMNNEYRVAHQVAAQRGAAHEFIPRPPLHYASIFEDAVRLGGAMNAFDHAHFLGLGGTITPKVDVLLHGYALDFLFQGKYLPANKIKLAGKPTYLRRLRPLRGDLADHYVAEAPYRLKSIDALDLIQERHREGAREALTAAVRGVLDSSHSLRPNPYRQWEYLHIHNLSRHFTYLLVLSIRTFVKEETLAFDNTVFDLFFRMPAKERHGGDIFKKALKRLDAHLPDIVSANTNMPAGFGPWRQTATLIQRKSMQRLGMPWHGPLPPSPMDRSWTDRKQFLEDSPLFRSRIDALGHSEFLGDLDFVDMDRVRSMIETHRGGERNHADALVALLTLEQLLKSFADTTQHAYHPVA